MTGKAGKREKTVVEVESANKNLGGEKKKMKTKNKMIAVVEIAIVLCSVFLVALPMIAAEQTAQKVSASEVTATSEDNTLEIYGNANEDDTIDMRDLTYVKLIFFGKKPVTELADAKYDGKINPLDFIQIKLIIVGKEKELTIVQYIGYPPDFTEEPVTVPMPIERIVAIGGTYGPETLCAFEAQDEIVGVLKSAKKRGELSTFLEDKPVVGTSCFTWDIEKIMEQEPDIVLAYAFKFFPDYDEQLHAFGVPLVQMDFHAPAKYSKEIRNLGWILSKQERAEELVNFEQQYLDLIKERVEDLEPEQKPRVYFEWYKDYQAVGSGTPNHNAIIMCGGINIFDDETEYPMIDPEAVPARKPQVIIKCCSEKDIFGYDATDTAPLEEKRNGIMTRDGWGDIDAITSERVYLLSTFSHSTHTSVFYSYIAKWLHPELFKDIDPVDVHSDWFERFLGIEYKGLYAYPAYPVS